MQPTQSPTHLPSFPVIFLHSTSHLLMHYIIYYFGCVGFFLYFLFPLPNVSYTQAGIYVLFNDVFLVLEQNDHKVGVEYTLKGRTVFNSSWTESHPLKKNIIANFFPKGDYLPFGRPRFQTCKEELFLQMCQLH